VSHETVPVIDGAGWGLTGLGQLLRYGFETGVFSEVALGEGRPVNNDGDSYSCGIHTITASPSGRLVASGGINVNDCVVYELPHLRPVASLQAHSDWIFGTTWLDEFTLVTASRDSKAMIWSLRGDYNGCQTKPRTLLESHKNKIRSCVTCRPLDCFATLSIDGILKVWDSNNASELRTIELTERRELSCMAPTLSSHHELAIGSKAHFALVDVRADSPTRLMPWLDNERIRSISWLSNVLVVGGAKNKGGLTRRLTVPHQDGWTGQVVRGSWLSLTRACRSSYLLRTERSSSARRRRAHTR
jgi:WD40 repeat protein